MKLLCTCAALAVAAAFAPQHFADAMLRSNAISARQSAEASGFTAIAGDQHCVVEINTFRTSLKKDATEYEKKSGSDYETDLTTALASVQCDNLYQGTFKHINDDVFIITAPNPEKTGSDMTCELAITQWEKAFEAFGNKHPPGFKDYQEIAREGNVYDNPSAAGLFGLLQTKKQTVACGTFSACSSAKFLFCYFKTSQIQEGAKVDAALWHALEAKNNIKPSLEAKGTAEEDYLKAVNDMRSAGGLSLAAFTNPLKQRSMVKRAAQKSLEEVVQEYLYQLTCDDIKNSNIKPAAENQNYTIIYYIKDIADGSGAPDITEAVKHWQTGFAKLNYKIPPAFKLDSMKDPVEADAAADPAVEASKIYNDSAVAGYVSLLAEETRQMACVQATGCDNKKAALICFLHKPTLVDNTQPISQEVWTRIMKNEGYTLPQFTQLEEGKNCLTEMNAVRTQEKLGLKPFLATVAKSRTATNLSAVMQSVTCEAMDKTSAKSTETAGPQIMITDGTTSLMYHTGTEGTCSEAVEAFKKGYEKFSSAPPAYKSDLAVYQDPAATNFVSLISDGDNTKATCYSTSCTKKSIVCELSPAALKESEKPVSEATFTKYTEIMKTQETSGAAGFSRAALFGTLVMAIAAGVFFF